jgi:hypothetical protein
MSDPSPLCAPKRTFANASGFMVHALERDEIRLGPFSSPAPDAAQQECCEPGVHSTLHGLFSRFFVQALPRPPKGRYAGSGTREVRQGEQSA